MLPFSYNITSADATAEKKPVQVNVAGGPERGQRLHSVSHFFYAFAKLRKATLSFVMSVLMVKLRFR
jgi:hypothetical protein